MTGRRRRLILFTRFPEEGRVKTRLIAALGSEGATALHRRLLLRTLRTAEAACQLCDADLEVRFDGGSEELFHHWLGDHLTCKPQDPGDLGDRLADAFEASIGSGCSATIVIGSDSPGLSPELLADAFEKLVSNAVVLGPACDGGYYLIGLARHIPELFRGVPWGSDRVLEESLRILASSDVKPLVLPLLDDIDRPEDLPVWQRIAKAEDADLERISVIIPALNEARSILPTIESVRQAGLVELLVIDGGSSDDTAELAHKAGTTVLKSQPGRARQMNAGAAKATGNVLMFLHADTILPQEWRSVVSSVMQDAQVAAGAFGFGVAGDFRGKRMLELTVNWRARRFQMPYGDQGLFLKRALFEEVGGFAKLPVMEDYELMRRLRRRGRIAVSPQPAVTSGRRWRRLGLLRATLKNQLMIAGFHLGVSPETLGRFYRVL